VTNIVINPANNLKKNVFYFISLNKIYFLIASQAELLVNWKKKHYIWILKQKDLKYLKFLAKIKKQILMNLFGMISKLNIELKK